MKQNYVKNYLLENIQYFKVQFINRNKQKIFWLYTLNFKMENN